jgi:hypothetical protein
MVGVDLCGIRQDSEGELLQDVVLHMFGCPIVVEDASTVVEHLVQPFVHWAVVFLRTGLVAVVV